MKKITSIILVLLIAIYSISPSISFGQTPTSEAESEEKNEDTIERIKDLVASKVAELNLVERRGIIGTVRESSNTQITLIDQSENPRTIDIDELTKFEGNDSDFGISDIEDGQILSIIGLYNKDNQRLLARFVKVANNIPTNIDGLLTEIDREEFTLTIASADGTTWIADIATSTKTYHYDGEKEENSGFSRLEEGQRVIAVGFENNDGPRRISASRVLHFTTIPFNIDESVLENMNDSTSTTSAETE